MAGKVSEEVALDYASSPHDFKLMLAAGGQRASGIEQLAGPGADDSNDQAQPAQDANGPAQGTGMPVQPAPSAPPPGQPVP
jgi:hypothetical protein